MTIHGFVFNCNRETYSECINRKVFGLPIGRMEEVTCISPCTPLFLYNKSTKELFCGFEAAGYGRRNVVPGAFKGRFPAQVQVKLTRSSPVCMSLHQFKHCLTFEEGVRGKSMKQALERHQVEQLQELVKKVGEEGRCGGEVKRSAVAGRPGSQPSHGNLSGERCKKQRLDDAGSVRFVPNDGGRKDGRNEEHGTWNGDTKVGPVSPILGSERTLRTSSRSGSLQKEQSLEGNYDPEGGRVLGERVGNEVCKRWGMNLESRTTVTVYPLPQASEMSVKALVSVLDKYCKNRYQFLLVKTYHNIGRVLHVDFVSVCDMIKFHMCVSENSWHRLINDVQMTDPINMHFWDGCQGLKMLKAFYSDTLHLHIGEASSCSKLEDDVPIVLIPESPQYTPLVFDMNGVGNIENGIDGKCYPASAESAQPSSHLIPGGDVKSDVVQADPKDDQKDGLGIDEFKENFIDDAIDSDLDNDVIDSDLDILG